MAYRWCGLAVILVALPLSAGTINVSAQVAALLDTGDALSFTVPASNFGINAGHYGIPVYPTSVGFVFVSAAEDPLAQIAAVLESGDGSVSVRLARRLALSRGRSKAPAIAEQSRFSRARCTSPRRFRNSCSAIRRQS